MKHKLSDYGINGDDYSIEYSNPQTAVEWLVEELNKSIGLTKFVDTCDEDYKQEILGIINQAKEMEKQQAHEYAEFAIRCDRKEMKILNFDGFINLE